jgi:FKBP-type peptidyl-prolyl cis-trans isomerase
LLAETLPSTLYLYGNNDEEYVMARPHERVIAIVAALLFLATSVGFSGVVVWQMYQEDKANNKTTTQSTDKKGEKMLQGTKLEGFTPTAKVEELQRIDKQMGTGSEVKAGDTITAHYTGAVAATGVIFQSSHDNDQAATFSLNQVIKGWTEGVPGMKVGGKRRLLIPAEQAYGANPPQGSGIPVNADLVFDIELVKIGE